MTEGFEPTAVTFNMKLRDAFTRLNANLVGSDTDLDQARADIAAVLAEITAEAVQDKVAGLFVHDGHANLTSAYDDAANRVIFSAVAAASSVEGGSADTVYLPTQNLDGGGA